MFSLFSSISKYRTAEWRFWRTIIGTSIWLKITKRIALYTLDDSERSLYFRREILKTNTDYSLHVTNKIIKLCLANKIVLLCLFSYFIDFLQFFDVVIFGLFVHAYKKNLKKRTRYGKNYYIDKVNFLKVIQLARHQDMTSSNIALGWR